MRCLPDFTKIKNQLISKAAQIGANNWANSIVSPVFFDYNTDGAGVLILSSREAEG